MKQTFLVPASCHAYLTGNLLRTYSSQERSRHKHCAVAVFSGVEVLAFAIFTVHFYFHFYLFNPFHKYTYFCSKPPFLQITYVILGYHCKEEDERSQMTHQTHFYSMALDSNEGKTASIVILQLRIQPWIHQNGYRQ